ncbi:MAG: GLUG motif-containing protein [Pseudomonadota bacterium]
MNRMLPLALLGSTALVSTAALAQELPTGGQLQAGAATITTPGAGSMQITQTSDRAIINWQSFSVGAGGHVDISQPSATAALLNRVTGSTTSEIAGQITANGRVFLVNPNGILITSTGTVRAAGFTASTLDIADNDFMAGADETIVTAQRSGQEIGYLRNGFAGAMRGDGKGLVQARVRALGASGEQALDLGGDGFLQVQVPSAGITVAGRITANDIVLTAGTARDMARGVVNVSGVLDATSVTGHGGTISLTGATVQLVGATLDASGATGGGAIRLGGDWQGSGTLAHATELEVDAASLIRSDARQSGDGGRIVLWSDERTQFSGAISARGAQSGAGGEAEVSSKGMLGFDGAVDLFGARSGTLLLDPRNVTIVAGSGGTLPGGVYTPGANDSQIGATSITNALAAGTNVTITTGSTGAQAGNITVNSAISWSGNAGLTLNAANNIIVNAAITATGTANAAKTVTLIAGRDINTSATISTVANGSGNAISFTAGRNISIGGAITTPGTLRLNTTGGLGAGVGGNINVGKFVQVAGSWRQVAAVLPTFSAGDFQVAAGASFMRATSGDGSAANPFALVDVYGLQGVGTEGYYAGVKSSFILAGNIDASGTAGWNGGAGFVPIGGVDTGNVYQNGSFDGRGFTIAGLTINLPGKNNVGLFGANGTLIQNLRITGANVTGAYGVGVLVGTSSADSLIRNVSVSGTVHGTIDNNSEIGGLIGQNAGSIDRSSANVTMDTATAYQVGGLAGSNVGSITNSYAAGTIYGMQWTGGLVGNNVGTINNSHASASVIGSPNGIAGNSASIGGLVGINSGAISNAYATGDVIGGAAIGGLVGLNGGIGPASITQSWASGKVTGSNMVGGLIGNNEAGATAIGVYATGAVSAGFTAAGGLVGQNQGSVSNAYATGAVTGQSVLGGLIGNQAGGSVSNAYWDSYSTGRATAFGANSGSATNILSVTSDPLQAAAANYAYKASAYANLTAASGIGNETQAGFVFVAGNSTRPFLAFEVPTSFTTTTDAGGRLVIFNSHQLQLIGYDQARLSGQYSLAGNIDLAETGAVVTGTPGSYSGMWAGTGFVPIGTDGLGNAWNGTGYTLLANVASGIYGFTGLLNGNGFTLSNLRINRAAIKNVGLFGLSSGTLSAINVNGSVSGLNGVGGLVGMLYAGGSVSGSTSAVNVTGNNLVGGLVGNQNDGSSITQSSASGNVSGVSNIGGLVGYASGATINRSFATGTVTGANYVGGLIGYQYNSTTANSYATGRANASVGTAGGLVGYLYGGSVANSYSTGLVIATRSAGGLIGQRAVGGTVTSSYWDMMSSGQATSAGGTGLTTAQMRDPLNYTGWNFVTIWNAPNAGALPALRP